MYMHRRTYVKNWSHQSIERKFKVTVKRGGKELPKEQLDSDNISEVIEGIAYWRKANAVHNWFVNNVQDGKDDCGEYYVSEDKLKELVDTCKKVIAGSELVEAEVQNGQESNEKGEWVPIMEKGKIIKDPSLAKELLPTASGFFFGSTDYDQWYYEDVKSTIEMLEPYINQEQPDEPLITSSFYYSSSW